MVASAREHMQAQGLYDPTLEHDACGVGFVARLDGAPSHHLVEDALAALGRMAHRGGASYGKETADGAGILIPLPRQLMRRVWQPLCGPLPDVYAVGHFFLPAEAALRAQVEGIMVLNINELAKSLRMSHLPGDTLELELTQKGQDSHQAIGHLRDGTMVVVEQAKKFIGQIKRVEIIRSLQTDAGKMMFAKIVETGAPTDQTHGRADAAPKQRSAGRKVSTQKTSAPSQSRIRRTSTPAKDTNDAAARSPKQQQTTRSRRPKTSAQREAELIRLVDEQ